MDDLADLRQRIANLIRRGVVSEVKMGNPVTVRVTFGRLTSPWLPWCQSQSSRHVQISHPPSVGDAVTILSESGEIENGRVYPGANIDAIPVPSVKSNEHVMKFDNGTTVSYDRDENHLSIILAEGGTWKIKGDGVIDGKLTVNNDIEGLMDIKAHNDVIDKIGTMNNIRIVYNGHNHNGDSGGQTGEPNSKM
jgi:phage baseplate assembly protein V